MHKVLTRLPRYMSLISAAIIALMPLHAFLTVWLSSNLGHYTAFRLWKEVLLLVLFLGFVTLFITRPKFRLACRREPLILLMAGYVIFVAALGLTAHLKHGVGLKAYAYGLLLDTRYLVFFGCTWAATLYSDVLLRWWKRLLLVPAAVVGAVAVAQYWLLPADFLRHFGYGPKTIPPTETIDQQAAYQRVQATLRGANPLGTYEVLVVSALTVVLLRAKKLHWKVIVQYVLAGLALVFSFSRGAWLGAVLSIAIGVWLAIASMRLRRYLLLGAAVFVLAAGGAGYALRHNARFENVFFHTSQQSQSAESSNAGHASALKNGLIDVAQTPWGHGTGTAGPASVYNHGQVKIAENYYVQIGQEVGLLGLAAFLVINGMVALRLWQRRTDSLAALLLISLAGISLVNMLSHAWADDTLAYIWWGLAGAACAVPAKSNLDAAE